MVNKLSKSHCLTCEEEFQPQNQNQIYCCFYCKPKKTEAEKWLTKKMTRVKSKDPMYTHFCKKF